MKIQPPTLLLFDADNTLLDFTASQTWALSHTLARFGMDDTPAVHELYSRINHRLWAQLECQSISSQELRLERFRLLLETLDTPADHRALSSSYLEFLAQGTHLVPGARQLLSQLHGIVPMAIATNGIKEIQHSRLKGSGLAGFFEEIIVSEEAGAAKPDQRFFSYAFSRLGFSPADRPRGGRAVMIGDSLSSDIRGGNLAGIHTCWFSPGNTPAPEPMSQDSPTYTITALDEVLGLPGLKEQLSVPG